MLEVNIHEAKTQFSKLLERVVRGEEIVIAKAGKPIARLVPLEGAGPRVWGQDRDVVRIHDDFYHCDDEGRGPIQLMTYLLDTHVWLWLTTEPERLDAETRALLAQSNVILHLSVASAWEIGIKYSLGKVELPQSPEVFIPSRLARDRIGALPVEMSHALKAAALPLIHKDPFDRLLVAQAQSAGMCLVTHDPWAQKYEVDFLAV